VRTVRTVLSAGDNTITNREATGAMSISGAPGARTGGATPGTSPTRG
jgi:hypothetical protein